MNEQMNPIKATLNESPPCGAPCMGMGCKAQTAVNSPCYCEDLQRGRPPQTGMRRARGLVQRCLKALLPQSKFDSAPLPALAALDDVQFTQAGPELLTWLQDENYPIFHEVLALLAQRQACIAPALEAVFHTQDWIWQHAVLQHLYPRLTPQNQALLLPQIRQLARKPQPMDEDALALQALAASISDQHTP